MNGRVSQDDSTSGHVTFRYWASARAAAGVAEEQIPVDGPLPLAVLIDRVLAARSGGDERLSAVLATCSVLLGDQPVASADPAGIQVSPGQVVEFLPPFAGG